jgi:hypothetical protein
VLSAALALALWMSTPSDGCVQDLRALGVHFVIAPARPGVQPVVLRMPLNGIYFRYLGSDRRREELVVHCELAVALHAATKVLARHGVVEVTDVETYRFRCKDARLVPPDCSLSLHALALAIDIAGFTTRDGLYHSVESDWHIDQDRRRTCDARVRAQRRKSSSASDVILHEVLCDLRAHSLFSYYLTPNYNAAHRNHWHLDLLPAGPPEARKFRKNVGKL